VASFPRLEVTTPQLACTPSYYILDPKGVIRHEWVGALGEKAIYTALEKLINEAEVNGKKSP